jgi:hypothetical protein
MVTETVSGFSDVGGVPGFADDVDCHAVTAAAADTARTRRRQMDALLKVRGRGRPSLSESGESPLLRVRLSQTSTTPCARPPSERGRPGQSGCAKSSARPAERRLADGFGPADSG